LRLQPVGGGLRAEVGLSPLETGERATRSPVVPRPAGPSRPLFRMATVVVVLGLVCSFVVVVLRRGSAEGSISDRRLIARQVRAVGTGGGLFAAQALPGPGPVAGTAWTGLLQRLRGRQVLRPQATAVAGLVTAEPAGPWRDLYRSVVGSVAKSRRAL